MKDRGRWKNGRKRKQRTGKVSVHGLVGVRPERSSDRTRECGDEETVCPGGGPCGEGQVYSGRGTSKESREVEPLSGTDRIKMERFLHGFSDSWSRLQIPDHLRGYCDK